MAEALIYKPSKSATQSGVRNTKDWVLEFENEDAKTMGIDPLMGWISSSFMPGQLHLKFHNKEEAIRFAESKNVTYHVIEPELPIKKPKAYADNFLKRRS